MAGGTARIARPAVQRSAAGLDHHAARFLPDHLGRGAEHHPVAERLGQPDRDGLGALVEAALLSTPAGADQQGHAPRRADVEQGVQQRRVAGLGGQRPPDHLPQPGPDTLRRHPGLEPGLDRLGVPGQRLSGRPGRLQRHRGRHRLQLTDGLADGDRVHRVVPVEDVAVVAVGPAVVELDVRALLIGRVGGHADPIGQGGDAVLGRTDPLAAVVERSAVGRGQGQGPPADPFTGLHHHHLGPGVHQPAGRGQPGQAGPDHDDVCCGGQRSLLARMASWAAIPGCFGGRASSRPMRAPSGMPMVELSMNP